MDVCRGYVGWHARNCVLSPRGLLLVVPVENCLGELAEEETVESALGRLRKREDELIAVRRQTLIDTLAEFVSPPLTDDAARANLGFVGAEFDLDEIELKLVEIVMRTYLVDELDTLADAVVRKLRSASEAAAALIGHDAREVHARLLPHTKLITSGILTLNLGGRCFTGKGGVLDMPLNLRRVMARPYSDRQQWAAAILGPPCTTTLTISDFPHVAESVALATRLLTGAQRGVAKGLNILLHGPVGTGKTELAKAIAGAAQCSVWSIGECDQDGDEPTRSQRVAAVRLAQRLLSQRKDAVLLVDEAEDVLGSGRSDFESGDGAGSKVFINRLLEAEGPPVIWTANKLSQFDRAFLRRMVMAISVPEPPASVRREIWAAGARRLEVPIDNLAAERLAHSWDAPPAVINSALTAAAFAGGGERECDLAMRGVMQALGRSPTSGNSTSANFDAAVIGCDTDLNALADRFVRAGSAMSWSLLISGPPGTGKSQYARSLAERMGMPVLQQRASDLLSKWVGESEQKIAAAFARASDQGAMLVFDEADSLLSSRASARARWEVSQVNEMLTWMEGHSLPFVCTTNLLTKMDDASLRRFSFKLKFTGMSAAQAERHFVNVFGMAANGLVDGLTPGDFAVAQRRRLFEPDADLAVIMGWLEEEVLGRSHSGSIGFELPARQSMPAARQRML